MILQKILYESFFAENGSYKFFLCLLDHKIFIWSLHNKHKILDSSNEDGVWRPIKPGTRLPVTSCSPDCFTCDREVQISSYL